MVASPPREEIAVASRNVNAKQARQLQATASRGVEHKPRPQQDKGLKCPRCPSTNTKFCYYNNNSVAQPRFFCKACRRYWTVGGTQRNIPVGGSCRKNTQGNKAAASSVSSSESKKMDLSQQLKIMPTATTPVPADFPNVLLTFMSTTGSVQLPTGDKLPFTPLPLPSNPAGTMPSFLDMMRAGGELLDSGSNGMAAMPDLLPAPSFAAMLQNGHGMMQGVDQEVKLPITAVAGGWSAGGGAVHEQEQQVVVGGAGGSAPANNNSKGGGAFAGSIIDYWQ
ncbi:unnamed protein product [Urochloa humidicola]